MNYSDSPLIIVCSTYQPDTAQTNRIFAMLETYEKMSINVEVVYVFPNAIGEYVDLHKHSFLHIHFSYLWDKHRYKNKYIKHAISFIDVWKFAGRLKKGTNVYLYECNAYVPFFVRNKGIRVYQETTEHYNAVPTVPRFLQKSYLRSIPRLAGMFVISEPLQKAFLQLGAKKVTIVNMIVDSNRFTNITKQPTTEEYVAYCGKVSNNKDGVDILIKSFAIVHNYYPNLKLYIIGQTPIKREEKGHIALIHDLGLDNTIIFKGLVPAEQMPQVLTNAKILALARPNNLQSQYGFPTKLGEYLLTKNPVVVTKVGDIPKFLQDRQSAIFAEPDNPEDFAKQISWVLTHPEEAEKIGNAGQHVALEHFNNVTETLKIYKTIYS